ncbi:MAG: hypothetical protein P8X48_12295 [Acidiferrobacteraceae bacterium]|jgi:hypothetical protein
MDFIGPFRIGIMADASQSGHELHIDFTEEFRGLDLAERTAEFERYMDTLRREAVEQPEGSRERQGMITVLQIAEQLAPHIAADEIVLSETIVVEIEAGNPLEGLFPSGDTRH